MAKAVTQKITYMHFPPQLIRLTKSNGANLWINPEHMIYAEQYEKKPPAPSTPPAVKDPKTAREAQPVFETILHMAGKEPKIFVKEPPEEINKILRSLKRTTKVEKTINFG